MNDKPQINKAIKADIPYRSIATVIIILMVIILFISINSTRISGDPKAYPYRFLTRYAQVNTGSPLRSTGLKFLAGSAISIVSCEDANGTCKYDVRDYFGDIIFSGGGGRWCHESPEFPLYAYYDKSTFSDKTERRIVQVYAPQPAAGKETDLEPAGRWLPLTGQSVPESKYAGILQLSAKRWQLIRKDGSADEPLKLTIPQATLSCPIVELRNGDTALLISAPNGLSLLYDPQGRSIAVTHGRPFGTPIRVKIAGKLIDLLQTSDPQTSFLMEVIPGSAFWWLFRWRGMMILFGVLSALGIALNPLMQSAARRRKSHLSLLNAYKEMEAQVEERTRDIARTNELLEREVEQRKKAESELRIHRDHLEAIFNSVYDGIISVDDGFKITQSNRTFRKMFRIDDDEKSMMQLRDLVAAGFDAIATVIERARKTRGTAQDYQAKIKTQAGVDLILRVTAMPLQDGSGSSETMVVFRDVTQLYSLQAKVMDGFKFSNIKGQSEPMRRLFHLMEEISSTETTVLITGESGTGKDLVANALHYRSPRAEGALIAVNCAALTDNLLESELFGHVKGAFTGATRDRMGLFEAARGGTLFLDEIGDISLSMQAKLLRVLQDGEYARVGETKVRKSDARVIAATNQDLKAKIDDGSFRQDLYFRLNVFSIQLPTLRERREDIPLLVDHFRIEFNRSLNKDVKRVSDEAMERLLSYPWHGNIRELKNIINGAMILCHGDTLEPRHFHPEFFQKNIELTAGSAAEVEPPDSARGRFMKALDDNFWNVTKTAKYLAVSRTYIYKKIKEYNIDIPR